MVWILGDGEWWCDGWLSHSRRMQCRTEAGEVEGAMEGAATAAVDKFLARARVLGFSWGISGAFSYTFPLYGN